MNTGAGGGARPGSSIEPTEGSGPVATMEDVTAVRQGGVPAKRHQGAVADRIFTILTTASGVFVLLLLSALIVELFIGGLPAFQAFGIDFLWSTSWNPVRDRYGAGVAIYGTLISAVIAIAIAVPLAFGVAFFLTELAPHWARRSIGTAVELLAAVPSIIYGMWGFFVLAPVMASFVQPALIATLGNVPLVGFLFAGPPFGVGIFTAAIVLAIMILPFIAATMRDVLTAVPPVLKEAAYGLGATKWEVVRSVSIPYTRVSLIGGIMLGLGRALGETMAVTFVIGNTNRISSSILGPGNTIASVVALEFPEAETGSLKLSALLALGFLLFVISFIVLAVSRYLLRPKFQG